MENVQDDGSIKPPSNLDSKTAIERLFFNEFNAQVEYFLDRESKYGPEEPLGFRIVRDSSDQFFLLEIKSIPNFKEVNREVEQEHPTVGMTLKELEIATDRTICESGRQNMATTAKRREESLKRYRVETRSLRISDWFAEALYEKIVNLIDCFDSEMDGSSVRYKATFRCVVGNEVWTLALNDEFPTDALALSDLCRQIIANAGADRLDESLLIERNIPEVGGLK